MGEPFFTPAKKVDKSRAILRQRWFFYIDDVVHKGFVPPDHTASKKFYSDILWREDMTIKRPEKWRTNDWLLFHDNGRPHTAYIVQGFLVQNNMAVVPHAPYSPDLAPSNFFLFPKMNNKLKGRRSDTNKQTNKLRGP
jgi:histone-lysine N-methyltransferase SETMAR